MALTSDADVRFFIRAFSQAKFTRTTRKPKELHEKYAKEDQREQVMSAFAREGTFAEVEFNARYSFHLIHWVEVKMIR